MAKKQEGGVNITNSSVKVNGDIVGRDKIEVNHETRATFTNSINVWEKRMKGEVENSNLSSDEKDDLTKQLELIKSVLVQDKGKDPTRLEKLINTLAVMSPDIFDVAVATIANPLAGIGLAIRKISNKAKIEVQNQISDSSK